MLVIIAFLISIFFITQALVPWRLPGENHGVEVRNDDYYEADNPGSKFRLHGNDMIYHGVLSVVTFPTYSSHYDDPAEDPVLNISEYFNLSELNTTSVLLGEQEEELPRMSNLGLAVALYLACLATVFGNSLVVIAVVKVGLKYYKENGLLLVSKEIYIDFCDIIFY